MPQNHAQDSGISDLTLLAGVLLAQSAAKPAVMDGDRLDIRDSCRETLFGGLGYNPFNPALMGRIFL